MSIDSIFLLIVIGGLILGLIIFAFLFHYFKKKSIGEKSRLKFLIGTFVGTIIFLLIISFLFSLDSDHISFWSTFLESLKSPSFIGLCILFIFIVVTNRLYYHRQNKGKSKNNDEEE
jgi:NADH:ubiquinone oxidoreductase subunit 6 (subunit J)